MRKILFVLLFGSISLVCNAQKLVLTANGMRSSQDQQLDYVEYVSKELGQKELFDYCVKELSGVSYLSYSVEKKENKEIALYGYIESTSLIVFGKSSIRFIMTFIFEDGTIRIKADLTKNNGNELNCTRLFSKKGKVRLAAPKNKIEDEINTLIRQIIGNVVVIES